MDTAPMANRDSSDKSDQQCSFINNKECLFRPAQGSSTDFQDIGFIGWSVLNKL